MRFLIFLTAILFSANVFATASSVTQTGYVKSLDHGKPVRVVHLAIVASSVDGSVANVTVPHLHGFLMKAIVKPGATNPTAAYTIKLLDPDVGVDSMNAAFGTLSASATATFFPVGNSGAAPLWFAPGDYTLAIASNSVDSALIDVWLYFMDSDTRAF